MTDLPVNAVLSELASQLESKGSAVLCAPPGSGKTTRVPIALMDMPWLKGQGIVMLEPRRVAARAAARYMAAQINEAVGQRIGYRVRFESVVSKHTRVEVVTEGVLARRLQHDPELQGIGLVIFDEFHERSLECDLALALTLDARQGLREDLRVLVMSATLDAAPIAKLLNDAPIVQTEGRSFPVTIDYQASAARRGDQHALSNDMAAAIRTMLKTQNRDVLAFLPGAREINRLQAALNGSIDKNILVCPLYGSLSPQEQDRAVMPDAQGRQRVVLATNIAETSLTIEGVAVVVDCGLARQPVFDPNSGLTRLQTVNISRASADQRAGRAGRLGPGTAIRLWSESSHQSRAAFDDAEIMSADLGSLVLELARWGVNDPATLQWLNPPPSGPWQQAVDLLQQLQALDEKARITKLGEQMAALPSHPRLARMLCAASDDAQRILATHLAAVLDGPDPLRGEHGARSSDLRLRAEALARHKDRRQQSNAIGNALRVAQQLQRAMGINKALKFDSDPDLSGRLLLSGFPDRLAQRRSSDGDRSHAQTRGRFVLANGRGLSLDTNDALAGAAYLVAPDLDAGTTEARAYRTAPVTEQDIREILGAQIKTRRQVAWNARTQSIDMLIEEKIGALVLQSTRADDADEHELSSAMCDGIRALGINCLPWTETSKQLIARIESLRHWQPEADWPALHDKALADTLNDWLAPYLQGITRREHLKRLDLASIIRNHIGHQHLAKLEQGAPTHFKVPTGSNIRLQYRPGEAPILAVKLQEMFGATSTPSVCWGQVPVLVHLLSPAGHPLTVTQDLTSFWINAYPQVRKETRGRYPKHPWPEDPTTAVPTRYTKNRQQREEQ